MASITNNQRNVIPNWRDYKTTIQLGELSSDGNQSRCFPVIPISDYVSFWKENRTLPYAGDLISAAITNGQTNNKSVEEAARFVIERKNNAPKSLYNIAQSILSTHENTNIKDELGVTERLNNILESKCENYKKIHSLRNVINRFPYNPIWYSELSLAYAKLGQMEKAQKVMGIAVHLAPESRYITRSAARLFIHNNDADRAHYILTNNPAIECDPWLMAAEISVTAIRNRTSRYIKKEFL